MALRELAAAFGISVDTSALENAQKSVTGFAARMKGALAGGVDSKGPEVPKGDQFKSLIDGANAAKAAIGGLFVFEAFRRGTEAIEEFVKEGAQLDDLSNKFGVTTRELQQFQFAAQMSGVEVEGMNKSLGFLQKNVGMSVQGNAEAAQAFASLGVRVKDANGKIRPLTDIATDVAEQTSKLGSESEMAGKLVHIFGREGASLIPLMKGGAKGVGELFQQFDKLGGGLSEDFIKKAAEADDATDAMKFSLKGLKSTILAEVLPAFTSMLKSRTENIVNLLEFARKTNIVALGLRVFAVGSVAVTTVKLIQMARAFQGFSGLFSVFGGGISGLLKLGLAGGIAGAAILVLFALFEDLYTLMTGGESVIGKVWEEFNGAGSSKDLVDQLRGAWDQLVEAARAMIPAGRDAMKGFLEALPVIIPAFITLVKYLMSAVLFLGQLAIGAATLYKVATAKNQEERDKAWKEGDKAIGSLEDARKGKEQSVFNQQTGQVTTGRVGGLTGMSEEEFMQGAGFRRGQFNAVTGKSDYVPSNINQANSYVFNVDGTGDPKATAEAVQARIKQNDGKDLQNAWAQTTRTSLGK